MQGTGSKLNFADGRSPSSFRAASEVRAPQKVTKEKFDKLEYDQTSPEGMNVFKMRESTMKKIQILFTRQWKLEDLYIEINKKLDTLVQIEVSEVCIPAQLAETYIRNAMELKDINHTYKGEFKLQKRIFSIWEENLQKILVDIFIAVYFKLESLTFYVDRCREKFFNELLIRIMECKVDGKENVTKFEILRNFPVAKNFITVFVFKSSDMNAAAHQIADSFNDPYNNRIVKLVYVQESCFDEFCKILEEKLRPFPNEAQNDEYVITHVKKIKEVLTELNATVIKPDISTYENGDTCLPVVTLNFRQDHFEEAAESMTPIICMQSFRTVKDAIKLSPDVHAISATIWCDNHSVAYEIIKNSKFSTYELNCHDIPPYEFYKIKNFIFHDVKINDDSIELPASGVIQTKNYHYQFFKDPSSDTIKRVISSFGLTFAN